MSAGHDATTPATSGEEESKRKGEYSSREFEENAKVGRAVDSALRDARCVRVSLGERRVGNYNVLVRRRVQRKIPTLVPQRRKHNLPDTVISF